MPEAETTGKTPGEAGLAADRRTAGRFLELLGAMKRFAREELRAFPARGMSEERFRTLLSLRLVGRSSLKTLAMQDGLSSSAQCIMLNRLVVEGFAHRAADERDRRRVLYGLTDAGRDLLDQEIARRTDLLSARIGRLKDGEKAGLARAIETLIRGVARLRSA
jgi:DNA-binding MarR family transcriptional regulator